MIRHFVRLIWPALFGALVSCSSPSSPALPVYCVGVAWTVDNGRPCEDPDGNYCADTCGSLGTCVGYLDDRVDAGPVKGPPEFKGVCKEELGGG